MKGIIFTEAMFNAVIGGRKTQTRRIVKPQPICLDGFSSGRYIGKPIGEKGFIKPRYKVGEKVFLKEPYKRFEYIFCCKYSEKDILPSEKWISPRFMPFIEAKYFIEITGVRCERLQDIIDEDCLKEGIERDRVWGNGTETFTYNNGINGGFSTEKQAYAALINKIYDEGTWESNPYMWVYDFKLINNQ